MLVGGGEGMADTIFKWSKSQNNTFSKNKKYVGTIDNLQLYYVIRIMKLFSFQ